MDQDWEKAIIDKLDERMNKLNDKLDKLNDKLDKLDERMNKLNDKLDKLNDKLDKLDERMNKLNDKLDKLEDALKNLNNNLEINKKILNKILVHYEKTDQACDRMNRHVELVEGVYATVRAPLEFLRSKISGNSDNQLPPIDSSSIKISGKHLS